MITIGKIIQFQDKIWHPKCRTLTLILLCFICWSCGCDPKSRVLEPDIFYIAPQRLVEKLPPAFSELTSEEKKTDWGKELRLGKAFAKELDLYRALTCFKRALFLLPSNQEERRLEIQYDIFLSYYIGNKYQEAIEAFESSDLMFASDNFPAVRDLLINLYDAYLKVDLPEKAYHMLCLLNMLDSAAANHLNLENAILEADFPAISLASENTEYHENISQFLASYECQALSVKKAQTLNSILPGAGYYYVGQKKAALTSFIINALFIAASYQLFDRGYIPAGIIVTSLETGWYFGGINGAGLAAKEYNERLYESLAKETLVQNRLFPILMIQAGF